MVTIKTYDPSMQEAIEKCYKTCLDALGWEYHPEDRHNDMVNIEEVYMRRGCFWCLFHGDEIIGMAAARCIDEKNNIVELKRLYVLPQYHGNGYGDYLFTNALDYVRAQGYKAVRLDTQLDRAASLHLIEKHQFRRIEQYNDNEFAELFFELKL